MAASKRRYGARCSNPSLIVLFGLAIGALALTMLSLAEDRRIAARVVVLVAMIPFTWFASFLAFWLITGTRPS